MADLPVPGGVFEWHGKSFRMVRRVLNPETGQIVALSAECLEPGDGIPQFVTMVPGEGDEHIEFDKVMLS